MIEISYDDEHLNFFMRQHPVFGMFAAQWSKEEFEALSGVDATPFAKVIYAPARDEYLVVMEGSPTVEVYDDPTQHPALNWMHNNAAIIQANAEAQHAESIDYIRYEGEYIPREDSLTMTELRNDRLAQANIAAFSAFSIVNSLAGIGSRAGLDITTQVNSKLVTIKTWLLDQRVAINALTTVEELRNYAVGAPVNTLDADIQWVMNQVI